MFLTILSTLSFTVLADNELQDLELLINPLELNRLFTSIHHERMQQRALLFEPGAHSHEGMDIAPAAVPSRPVAPAPALAPAPGPVSRPGPAPLTPGPLAPSIRKYLFLTKYSDIFQK